MFLHVAGSLPKSRHLRFSSLVSREPYLMKLTNKTVRLTRLSYEHSQAHRGRRRKNRAPATRLMIPLTIVGIRLPIRINFAMNSLGFAGSYAARTT